MEFWSQQPVFQPHNQNLEHSFSGTSFNLFSFCHEHKKRMMSPSAPESLEVVLQSSKCFTIRELESAQQMVADLYDLPTSNVLSREELWSSSHYNIPSEWAQGTDQT